jgi:ParB family transcriptional regulator, chromosome partitioning protein
VAGERRWRAAQRLSWTEITAIVRSDVDDRPLIRLALLENLARTDLDPLEEAMATARFRVWQELVQAGKLTLSAA